MTKSELTLENTCAKCGNPDMMLAVDQTRYTLYEYVDGVWMDSGSSTEDMDSGDPAGNVRFFCDYCGEYHNIPEELA